MNEFVKYLGVSLDSELKTKPKMNHNFRFRYFRFRYFDLGSSSVASNTASRGNNIQ